jgi:hypothetical protein
MAIDGGVRFRAPTNGGSGAGTVAGIHTELPTFSPGTCGGNNNLLGTFLEAADRAAKMQRATDDLLDRAERAISESLVIRLERLRLLRDAQVWMTQETRTVIKRLQSQLYAPDDGSVYP